MAEVHSSQEAPKIKLFGKMIALQGRQIKEEQKMNDQVEEEKRPEKIIPCPRCKSMETKFCYFNNYNVNQPRHFCKGCQRYWTAGGALRNVPVGAGRRKAKSPTQGLPGFAEACLFDSSAAHQYDLDIGEVEEWHILAQDGHIFQAKRRRNGQLC